MSESFLKTHQTTILIGISLTIAIALVYYVYKSTYGLKIKLQEKCTDYENILRHHSAILQQLTAPIQSSETTSVTTPVESSEPTILFTTFQPPKFKPTLETIVEEEEVAELEEEVAELDRELEEELEKIKKETV